MTTQTEDAQCPVDDPCKAVLLLKQQQDQHDAMIKDLKDGMADMLDMLRNRIPPWLAVILSAATCAVGVLATLAVGG